MFRIIDKTIHCTRGDVGSIKIKIPLKDKNGYLKYKDTSDNVYWYDVENKKLYDNDYKESSVQLSTLTLQLYKFSNGEVVRLNVFKKKDCGCIVIQKDVNVTETTDTVTIPLDSKDTTIGTIISKPTTYWYEIELNPTTTPQTVIGYDYNGEKQFILYPEGKEVE